MRRPLAVSWMMLCLACGCNDMNMMGPAPVTGRDSPAKTATAATAAPAGDAKYLGKTAVKGDDGQDGSAVHTALVWSEKHAKVTEDLMKVQAEKRELEESNRKLAEQLAKVQADGDAAQKELAEANQMLIEMRRELDAWKTNVLGFRDEMRSAQKAQMEAMKKVLILLGAEAPQTQTAGPATQPASQPAQDHTTVSKVSDAEMAK